MTWHSSVLFLSLVAMLCARCFAGEQKSEEWKIKEIRRKVCSFSFAVYAQRAQLLKLNTSFMHSLPPKFRMAEFRRVFCCCAVRRMLSERIRFDIQTRKLKQFFNENDWEVIWKPNFCPTKSRTLYGISQVSRLTIWRLFGIGSRSQAGCCSREYWMSKYCMFVLLEQRKQTTKKTSQK